MKTKIAGVVALLGVFVFVALVISLHLLQTGYDPKLQLMSELALGKHGAWMLYAFLSLAIALLALAIGYVRITPITSVVLLIAAFSFAGAGLYPLGANSEMHIALVAIAFVAVGLAMYWLPTAANATRSSRALSWGLLAVLAISVALGHTWLPMGIGQRIAASAMLIWMAMFSWQLLGHQ